LINQYFAALTLTALSVSLEDFNKFFFQKIAFQHFV
jgi:hypothetical protein